MECNQLLLSTVQLCVTLPQYLNFCYFHFNPLFDCILVTLQIQIIQC